MWIYCGSGLKRAGWVIPPAENNLMGGTGGCMLGGSEEDLCRPHRSKEVGFQLQDADDWPTPPSPDNWTETEETKTTIEKSAKSQAVWSSNREWQLMRRGNVGSVWGCGEVGCTAGWLRSLAPLQTPSNVVKRWSGLRVGIPLESLWSYLCSKHLGQWIKKELLEVHSQQQSVEVSSVYS